MREREREREKTRGVEISGQQLRARKESPSRFKTGKEDWATIVTGKARAESPKSRFEIVRGVRKDTGDWETQSLRLNLSLFKDAKEAKASARNNLDLTPREQKKADKIITQFFKARDKQS